MAKSKKTKKDATVSPNDLERVIAHLDTRYEQGLECTHPDTGIIVTDGEYDGLRRKLKELRPDSKLFNTATASELVSPALKVVHDPPMTSIEKASHEDIAKQEEQLFKWLGKSVTGENVGKQKTVKGKTYKDEPVTYPSDCFYQATNSMASRLEYITRMASLCVLACVRATGSTEKRLPIRSNSLPAFLKNFPRRSLAQFEVS